MHALHSMPCRSLDYVVICVTILLCILFLLAVYSYRGAYSQQRQTILEQHSADTQADLFAPVHMNKSTDVNSLLVDDDFNRPFIRPLDYLKHGSVISAGTAALLATVGYLYAIVLLS